MSSIRSILTVAAAVLLLSGCGGEHETNVPSVQLTAATVSSTTVNSHLHTVSIPFSDISLIPDGIVFQYRSDSVNGHSHVIALSKQQIVDLCNGMQLSLVSSAPDTGTAHTHTWNILGGSVLYEMHCYNCHSNDKRNRNPMNVSFNASQTAAVINPVNAPVSTSPATTPDPNYVPSTVVVPIDATLVYAGRCAGCHSLGTVDPGASGDIGPNLSGKGGLVSGKFPVPGVVSHNGQSLTAAETTAMVSYLNAN